MSCEPAPINVIPRALYTQKELDKDSRKVSCSIQPLASAMLPEKSCFKIRTCAVDLKQAGDALNIEVPLDSIGKRIDVPVAQQPVVQRLRLFQPGPGKQARERLWMIEQSVQIRAENLIVVRDRAVRPARQDYRRSLHSPSR